MEFTLAGQHGTVEVSSGVKTSSDEDEPRPIVIDPSLTYRKHFRIPSDIDQDPEQVMVEVFSRSLPGPVNDFRHQFVRREASDPEKLDVLGLAVKEEDFAGISSGSPISGIYFFERLLSEESFSRPAQLRIAFPGGQLFAVVHEHLKWSRYIPDPAGSESEETQRYISEHFPEVEVEHETPAYPGDSGATGSKWASEICELLPESFNPDLDLRSESRGAMFEGYQKHLLVLLVSVLLVMGAWIGLQRVEQNRYERWINQQYRQLFNRKPRYPVRELRSRLTRARKTAEGESPSSPFLYPRLVSVDSALRGREFRLLHLSLRATRARLVLLVPSLEAAEGYIQKLRGLSRVQTASIVSSDSTEVDQFQFEVVLEVSWGT